MLNKENRVLLSLLNIRFAKVPNTPCFADEETEAQTS